MLRLGRTVLLATAACGRIGYEPQPQPITIGSEIRISNALGRSYNPTIAWAGDGYAIAWVDDRLGPISTYFSFVTAADAVTSSEVLEPSEGFGPSIAWTGSQLLLATSQNRPLDSEIWIARVDDTGNPLSDVQLTNAAALSIAADIASVGGAVAWEDERDLNPEIYVATIGETGTRTSAELRVSSTPMDSKRPSIAWTDRELLVAWDEVIDPNVATFNDEIFMARLDRGGNLITTMQITDHIAASQRAEVVWTGRHIALSWDDRRDGNFEIYFASFDASGNRLIPDTRISDALDTSIDGSIVWTGRWFGIVWEDGRGGVSELYFVRVAANGVVLEPATRITEAVGTSTSPVLAWNGSDTYGVAWSDQRDGNDEIYFVSLRE